VEAERALWKRGYTFGGLPGEWETRLSDLDRSCHIWASDAHGWNGWAVIRSALCVDVAQSLMLFEGFEVLVGPVVVL
jgi:hypothetical protein